MDVMMISGSRNTHGQTARATDAMLEGVTKGGGNADAIFLPTLQIERCRQCDDDGWGLCRREGRCVIDDDFSKVTEKIRAADAVIFATPVYFSDLSESLRAFLDRLRRTCTHETGRATVNKKPAVGICVAGGGGGGAPACCVSLEKVLTTCGFDVVDMMPVRRQNLKARLKRLKLAGEWLATKPTSK
jgi:multimeric flavodoxin WrbA